MNLRTLMLAACVSISMSMTAQVACENGFAGDYPCAGLNLLSFLDLNDLDITVNNATANDCWGWVDPNTGSEYALLGGRDRTIFINIDNPVNPVIIGFIIGEGNPSLWRDIKVYQDHAYIVSESQGHGMQIFDLSQLANVTNPPVEFQPDAHYTGFGNAHNIVINEETGFAYAVGTSQYNGGPYFMDISDPLNPVALGGHDQSGYTHDAHVVEYDGPDTQFGGKEIFFGCQGNSGFAIVDVSDKSDPIELFASSYVDQSYTHQGWLTEDHRYFLMNDEIDELDFGFNTRTLIWDVTDLTDAVLVGTYTGPTASTDHNLYTKGQYVYMSNYNSGLRIAEMVNLNVADLQEVAYFDVIPSTDAAGYTGTWSNYPYFPSGNIIVSAFHGFYVVGELPVSIEEHPEESYMLLPNPAHSEVMLSTRNDVSVSSIQVYDLSGRLVKDMRSLNSFSDQHLISVDGFDAGTYIIQINNNALTSRKLIVE